MTDEAEARAKVRAYLGHDDFELEEFPEGWRVRGWLREPLMGAPTYAIERATGELWEFASGVPPTLVSEDFDAVKADGRTIEVPPG